LIDKLRLRAQLLRRIRTFFDQHGVLEVDTPALSQAAVSDPHLHSFTTCYHGPGPHHGRTLYLHTSPEFAMKRLLATGSGCIYQIARVFRDGEAGRRHNPEFTLLEWYRVGFTHHRLMDEMEALLRQVLAGFIDLNVTLRLSYHEAFLRYLRIDPHRATAEQLRQCCIAHAVEPPPGMPVDATDAWLDLLLSHCIEPRFEHGRLVFIYDYPASQAALARLRPGPGTPALAERFELYLNGIELANGFHELNDPLEQRRRFERDNQTRQQLGLEAMPIDERLLAVLSELPDCAGVALGFDRLLMIAAGKAKLDQVLTFAFEDC
jgi:lysyl-tRNA synthetase class 2